MITKFRDIKLKFVKILEIPWFYYVVDWSRESSVNFGIIESYSSFTAVHKVPL